jgi:hypothetical protein
MAPADGGTGSARFASRAQRPVITGCMLSLYFCRLFVEALHNKSFSKSGVFLRVVRRSEWRSSPLISYYMKVLSIANAGKGAGPFF